ncbi:MAG: GNAT family N-acetyltransferase [Bacillota bacterium]|nr:GNAT family N-acetyltransferase [Bacillota bacterium]
MNIRFLKLQVEDAVKIREMDASQYIGKAWREVDGERKLVEIGYQDPTWPNGYEHHYDNLVKTIENKGLALGAFDDKGKLIGFVTVNAEVFGERSRYVLLDQLFITLEHRGKGIGKDLMTKAAVASRSFGAEKLFICAGSAEETIAFYKAMGCVMAEEINESLYNEDPRDLQMEYTI